MGQSATDIHRTAARPARPAQTSAAATPRGASFGLSPKERILRLGAAGLTETELLAVLLRCRSAEPAVALLRRIGGLRDLLRAERPALRGSGASAGQAAVVLAVGELVRRLAELAIDRRRLLDQPAVTARYLLSDSGYDQEVVGVLLLDAKHRLITKREIFRGTANSAHVEPRPILRAALQHKASALIVFHNHPSGDPSPSGRDLAFTRRLARAAELMGITLADHMILGRGGRWVSLYAHGACSG